ncbi:MAG: hypothetical protein AAF993_11380 [Pseudomonadota bacterium]
MSVTTEPGPAISDAHALQQLAERYPFTTTLDVPPVDNDPHWHRFDAEFYILDGDLILTGADNTTHYCPTGTKVVVPQGAVHAEKSQGYRIALGTSLQPSEYGDPVDRPVSELADT